MRHKRFIKVTWPPAAASMNWAGGSVWFRYGWNQNPTMRTAMFSALRVFLFLCAAGVELAAVTPEQPVPFSHKVHAGNLKMKCKMCHPNPDPGETMTVTAAAACMQCHSAIKTDSPAIQKVAAFAKNDREIKWARVYQIPSYVVFSHRAHLDSGNKCEECHGKVETRDQLSREADITMGGCMNCHRAKKASIDCSYCHEQQPPN